MKNKDGNEARSGRGREKQIKLQPICVIPFCWNREWTVKKIWMSYLQAAWFCWQDKWHVMRLVIVMMTLVFVSGPMAHSCHSLQLKELVDNETIHSYHVSLTATFRTSWHRFVRATNRPWRIGSLGNNGFWIGVRAIGINSWHWIDNSSFTGLFAVLGWVF